MGGKGKREQGWSGKRCVYKFINPRPSEVERTEKQKGDKWMGWGHN